VTPRVLLIDHFDSFTSNLAHALVRAGADVDIARPDQADPERCTHLVLSPGPGAPEDARRSAEILRAQHGVKPILGVCLGHQLIAHVFGWTVGRARDPAHGRTVRLRHGGERLFRDVPQGTAVARYHSLEVAPVAGVDALTIDATAADDSSLLMALSHRDAPTFGVQFHPESFLTEHGDRVLRNFLHSR